MLLSQKKEDFFEDFLMDISSVLEDLCESGFRTVHDSTLQELKEKGETAANYGMQYLSELLLSLQEELSASRHKFYHSDSDALSYENKSASANSQDAFLYKENLFARPAKYYAELINYIELGREKTAYDKGKAYYLSDK